MPSVDSPRILATGANLAPNLARASGMYLGVEIGGTKLQLALGHGAGHLLATWRSVVVPVDGALGIREQIVDGYSKLLHSSGVAAQEIRAIGVGFGGPIDDHTRNVICSHQIAGWDNFPLAKWFEAQFQKPAAVENDADIAGLGEVIVGAGQGCDSVVYLTIGTGIGGGLILNQQILRGNGRGAGEIGHLRISRISSESALESKPLEDYCSGPGIERRTREGLLDHQESSLHRVADPDSIRVQDVGAAADAGDEFAKQILAETVELLADALVQVIAILCPAKIIIGGGVSLLGELLLFVPLR